MITKKQVIAVLKTIPDPEIGVSLWDLGLIYEVTVNKKSDVRIVMTLTTIGCPLFSLISDPIQREVGAIPGIGKVEVELTFDPPWNTDKMSIDAKKQLGFL